jgi:hypothetical protein
VSRLPRGEVNRGAGTLTLVGADGAVHHELVDVAAGTLFWEDGPVVLLVQGVGSKGDAIRLVGP